MTAAQSADTEVLCVHATAPASNITPNTVSVSNYSAQFYVNHSPYTDSYGNCPDVLDMDGLGGPYIGIRSPLPEISSSVHTLARLESAVTKNIFSVSSN